MTQVELDALTDKLQYYKYTVAFGTTKLGPQKTAPKPEGAMETKDVNIYEAGSTVVAKILTKNEANITVESLDIDSAMALQNTFKKGDNVIKKDLSKALILVPITEDGNAKTITFPRAFLEPNFSPTFNDDEAPNSMVLKFVACEDENGILYTFE